MPATATVPRTQSPSETHGARVAATPAAFVQAVLQAYENRGSDPGKALEWAQIAPSAPDSLDAFVTATQFERLCGFAMRELNDEALGWFSRCLPWGSYGMLARASLSAPTLGLALKRWCRHHALIVEDISLTLTVRDGVAWLEIGECRPLGPMRELCLVSTLRNALGLASWLIDSRIALLEARFPFAQPRHAGAYPILFTEHLRFQAERAALAFDARYLALPLRRDETAMNQMLQHALPLTVRQYRRDRLLVQRVRAALLEAPLTHANAQAVAAQLAMSSRTLHRRLREEGASLQAIKDEVRRARAEALALRSARPIKQLAAEVGFRNDKSFSRAFRGWTGLSPAAFREARKA